MTVDQLQLLTKTANKKHTQENVSEWVLHVVLKGYWQVPLTARASKIYYPRKSALLQYTAMAFATCNAPATFQRLMWKVLSGVANCEAYLNHVVVYSADWQSHEETLSTVFQCLQEPSLTLNLVKCELQLPSPI